MAQSFIVVRAPVSIPKEEASSFVQTVSQLVSVLGDSYLSLDENGFRRKPIAVQNFVVGGFRFFQTASSLSIYFATNSSSINLLLEADRTTGLVTFLRSDFELHQVRSCLVETLLSMGGDYATFAKHF